MSASTRRVGRLHIDVLSRVIDVDDQDWQPILYGPDSSGFVYHRGSEVDLLVRALLKLLPDPPSPSDA